MDMEFNTFSLTNLAKTWADISGVTPPEHAKGGVKEIESLVKEKTGKSTVDRMLIYNPDAVGQWVYEKYFDLFPAVREHTDISVDYITMIPPKTPVCFATMFSGATPTVHGIQKYQKPVLTIDTLFDAWPRGGKKVAMVAVANQSIPRIFAERNIDYYLMPYDGEVIEKALELIEKDEYDIIEVYNQEYDDKMHRSHPKSKSAVNALKNYNASFDRLCKKVKECWTMHDTFTAFSTDHGVHRAFFGLGMHGSNIPKDMNIRHFYGVYPRCSVNKI